MLTRAESVAVARSWLGTPYRLHGRIKGVGTDCGMLLVMCLLEIGAVTEADLAGLGPYQGGWFLWTNSENYLRALMKFGTLIAEGMRQGAHPQPGDLALFKVARSKVYNHGAIVTEWPMGVHAGCDGVHEINLATHPLTSFRVMAVLDPFNRD